MQMHTTINSKAILLMKKIIGGTVMLSQSIPISISTRMPFVYNKAQSRIEMESFFFIVFSFSHICPREAETDKVELSFQSEKRKSSKWSDRHLCPSKKKAELNAESIKAGDET